MSDLIQQVNDGKVQNTATSSTSTTSKKVGGELGKDAFLQLLVTQMQYQDPLNPNTDTDYIAQLATFSQLEQLQNLSSTTVNTQAYNLVGKTVVVKTDDSTLITGKVDYVYTSGTSTKYSINGKLYSASQLDTVYDDEYLKELALPKVSTETKLSYDADNPGNLSFTVDLGSGDYVADAVAVAIGDSILDSSLVNLQGNKVTIDASAFGSLVNGSYKLSVAFNDSNNTIVNDMVTLQVTNADIQATTAESEIV